MTSPLNPCKSVEPFFPLFIEAGKTAFSISVDDKKTELIFGKGLESLNFCSDLKLKREADFNLPTLSQLLDLPYERETRGYLEMTPCVILIETIIEEVVKQGGIERRRAVVWDLDQEQEEEGRKLCQLWSSIFQVEREGRPWRILEKQKAVRKDVSLLKKIEETAVYKTAHHKVVGAIYARYLNLAKISVAKIGLCQLETTEKEAEKGVAQEFLSLLEEAKRECVDLDRERPSLEEEVEWALRSEERVFIKERVRILGEEAEARIKGEGLGAFSRVVEEAVKTIFDSKDINQWIRQAFSEVFFFRWKEKVEALEGRAMEIFLVASGQGSHKEWVEGHKNLEMEWRETDRKVNSVWTDFHLCLNLALKSCLSAERFFDAIKGGIFFDSFKSDLTASLETILVNFIKQGFFEALGIVKLGLVERVPNSTENK